MLLRPRKEKTRGGRAFAEETLVGMIHVNKSLWEGHDECTSL